VSDETPFSVESHRTAGTGKFGFFMIFPVLQVGFMFQKIFVADVTASSSF